MKNLISFLKARTTISSDLEDKLGEVFKRETFKSNDEILRGEQVCRKLYYLDAGTVRTYYYHDDKEVSSWFYKEDGFFCSWHSFLRQEAGFECIDALEDTVVYSITYSDYKKTLEEFPEFERFGRLFAEEQIAFMDYFFKGFMFLSAKEKYQNLLYYFPDIELKVKLSYIASFLGISRETLSRIRAEK